VSERSISFPSNYVRKCPIVWFVSVLDQIPGRSSRGESMGLSVFEKMKVLRYDWPTDFMFLLDILINPVKL